MDRLNGAEVARHSSRKSCWIALYGKVYDVTDFLDEHPGGAHVILRCAGQDATTEYESVHSPDLMAETLPSTAFVGTVEVSAILKSKPREREKHQQRPLARFLPLRSMISYPSAADDEYSKHDAARAFRKLMLRACVLRDVDSVDARTTILGQHTTMPVYVSPSGLGKYAHPDAECAFARGAGEEGLIQVVPTSPSMSIESIVNARVSKEQPVFFQLYLNRDHNKAEALIRRVEKLGVSAIWLTIDSPVLGNREQDDRLKAKMNEVDQVVGVEGAETGVAEVASSGLLNPRLTWNHIAWIRQITRLPLVLKGIQRVEDAVRAYDHGVEGIVLSNHGGRSQDTAQAPMITLFQIRRYAPHLINSRTENFVDGGIRRGTDVLKALALGARAVGIGRPFLYSLTGGYGEAGFRRMVQILRKELETNMATDISEIVAEMVNTQRLERDVMGSVKL